MQPGFICRRRQKKKCIEQDITWWVAPVHLASVVRSRGHQFQCKKPQVWTLTMDIEYLHKMTSQQQTSEYHEWGYTAGRLRQSLYGWCKCQALEHGMRDTQPQPQPEVHSSVATGQICCTSSIQTQVSMIKEPFQEAEVLALAKTDKRRLVAKKTIN